MKTATTIFVAITLFVLAGCRPIVRTGFTIDYDNQSEHVTQNVDPKWDSVTLRKWSEDNRGKVTSKVVGTVTR